MAEAIDQAAKEAYQLVELVSGSGSAYYTDWTSDVPFNGNDYISTPEIKVTPPENDGIFSNKSCDIELPLVSGNSQNDTLAERISNGQPHAPVTVICREIVRPTVAGPSQNINTFFVGQVSRARRHIRGLQNRIQVKCTSIKARIETVALGVAADITCDNLVGDARCKIDLGINDRRVPVVVASINGRELTIQANATVSGKADRFFHRGFAEHQGLNIGIREWRSADPLKFELVRQAPAHWVGASIVVVVGCDGSIETCRTRHNNESNFNGTGYGMPAYHPSFEDSPSA